jgi:hypothetical protein
MNLYRDRKDTAVTFYGLGLLVGMVVGFASCSPPTEVLDGSGHCVENCR